MNRLSLIPVLFAMFFASQANANLQTFVSISPQKWLVDRIGGELVTNTVLVGKGQDPHTFSPTPQTIRKLASASVWFTLDMDFEEQLTNRISKTAPKLRIVNTAKGVERLYMGGHSDEDNNDDHDSEHHEGEANHESTHDQHDHAKGHDDHDNDQYEHEADHENAHDQHDHAGGHDPHIWLSPENLAIMAVTIEQALTEVDPKNNTTYAQNRKQVEKELTKLHQDLTEILAPHEGASFYVFHPSFGYFAHAYSLKQQAVEVEGKSPTPRQLSNLTAKAREEGVKVIFVQPQFDSSSTQAIAEAINGEVVPLDPLAEDVTGNLRLIAERIDSALNH